MALWSKLTASACTSTSKSFKDRSAVRRVVRRALEVDSDPILSSPLPGRRPRSFGSEATPAARLRPTMRTVGEHSDNHAHSTQASGRRNDQDLSKTAILRSNLSPPESGRLRWFLRFDPWPTRHDSETLCIPCASGTRSRHIPRRKLV